MGISLSWVAVEGLSRDAVLARLELGPTGRHCTYPFKGVAGQALPNGWYLVAARGCDHRIGKAESLSRLSAGKRAVACAIEEHVNFASTALWQDGQRVWHVQHQGDEDPENISFQGDVPQRFHALLGTVEPGDSDNLDGYFHMDIPLMLAEELAGFRHDEGSPAPDDTPFDELKDLRARSAWWKLWR